MSNFRIFLTMRNLERNTNLRQEDANERLMEARNRLAS
jgi:hypothetical protein